MNTNRPTPDDWGQPKHARPHNPDDYTIGVISGLLYGLLLVIVYGMVRGIVRRVVR